MRLMACRLQLGTVESDSNRRACQCTSGHLEMRQGWASSGHLDALINTTRRLNQRHEWFFKLLFALVALNVLVELRALWTTHQFSGSYFLLRQRMFSWKGSAPQELDWQEQFAYSQDPPECLQLASVVELISGTLPDTDSLQLPAQQDPSATTVSTADDGSAPTPTLHRLARLLAGDGLDAASAAAYGGMLRENITAEVQPLLNGTCSIDLCSQVFRIPKIALMFLSKGELPHEDIWQKWFESAENRLPYVPAAQSVCVANNTLVSNTLLDTMRQLCAPGVQQGSPIMRQHLFSVYVHAPPSFTGFHNGSIFERHLLLQRTKTRWGSFELVLAAKLLLRQALAEPSNRYFVLLSESDVPLYPPSLVYQQIMQEPQSRIDACGNEDTSTRRYRDVLDADGVSFVHWRKSWQWFMLIRQHAKLVIDDKIVHRAFERHCNPSEEEINTEGGFDCYSDEHYIPSLLSVMGKENETSCQRTITNVDWRAQGAHPRTYKPHEINPLRIRLLRRPHKRCSYTAAMRSSTQTLFDIHTISAEGAEDRPGLCAGNFPQYNAPLGVQCPLFARKFPQDTHEHLMRIYGDCNSKLHILTERWCSI